MNIDFFQSISGLVFKYNSYTKLVEGLYLTAIVDSFQRLKKIPRISMLKENKIRNHLVYDIENDNKLLRPYLQKKILKITKENTILKSRTETRRTDIEFFISSRGDFVVECKNLRSAEQRYVDEGLKRFIEEDYSNADLEAGMIGFIIAGDIDSIIAGLKPKVKILEPTANCHQLLSQICIHYPESFHSEHNRNTKQPIMIHHLFVDFK